MLDRKIQEQLSAWKARDDRKSLAVSGARQVGKAHAVGHFGREYYQGSIAVSFKETPSAAAVFP